MTVIIFISISIAAFIWGPRSAFWIFVQSHCSGEFHYVHHTLRHKEINATNQGASTAFLKISGRFNTLLLASFRIQFKSSVFLTIWQVQVHFYYQCRMCIFCVCVFSLLLVRLFVFLQWICTLPKFYAGGWVYARHCCSS